MTVRKILAWSCTFIFHYVSFNFEYSFLYMIARMMAGLHRNTTAQQEISLEEKDFESIFSTVILGLLRCFQILDVINRHTKAHYSIHFRIFGTNTCLL